MMLTLRDILEQAETLHADRIAVATHGTRLSYIELIARARRLAAVLREHDVVPGDRVAILARNSFRYLEVNFACVLAGAVLVPLNVRLANVELTDLMRRTACRVVFCSHPLAAEDARPITWNDDCGPGGDCEYEALIAKAGATRESSAERGPAD